MLIRITHRCRMGCNHCLVDATPDGEHMETEVFMATLRFCRDIGDPVIMLTGGEPTEHPSLLGFLQAARGQSAVLGVLSNGMFFEEWEKPKILELLEIVNGVQVTNDPRYYPKLVRPYMHMKVTHETHLRVLSPQGRAVTNHLECNRQAPECFNLRSLVRAGLSLSEAMGKLYSLQRFCTPSINIDGSVAAGETPFCTTVGTVEDGLDKIARRISAMTCDRCGLVDRLDDRHKRAIGE